jgi:lysophospholipase L1-like esterase
MQPAHLTGRTLYQVVYLHAGGRQIRLRLSNRYGDHPLTLDAVFVGCPAVGLPLREGAARPVLFHGRETIAIEAGAEVVSDPINLEVEAFSNLAISFVVREGDILTGHFRAIQASYVSTPGAGNAIAEVEKYLPNDPKLSTSWWPTTLAELLPTYPLLTTSWWALTGVEVLPEKPLNVLVTLGDSTTDGFGSTLDANRRYPDVLARRLMAAGQAYVMSVLNAGISWNELLAARVSAAGKATLRRFSWDVLGQTAVTDVIVQIGINDLQHDTHADAIITGLQQLATRAHEQRLRIFGSTILPGTYIPEQAIQWRVVNRWLREEGPRWFDTVFDFASVLQHPEDETRLDSSCDCGDGVHPNDTGYQRMAAVVDLTRLTGSPALSF